MDARSATSGDRSRMKGKDPVSIDVMLEQLDLQDDEFNDLIVDEDDQEIKESVQWMAVAKVQTEKSFSHAAFFGEMRAAWNTAQPVKFRSIGENLFTLQASCLGDWERIVEYGPWLFRNWAVLIEPYDGFSRAEDIELALMPIWIQIHALPEGFCKRKIITQLVERAGLKVIAVKTDGIRGNYVRVRVKYDVRNPLIRVVSLIRNNQRQLFVVRYEKLAFFCQACGRLGHGYKECGRGVYEEKDLKYKEWLYADNLPRTNNGNAFNRNRGGGRMGRGGLGRGGRGNPQEVEEDDTDELKDTGTSPIKTRDIVMTDQSLNGRKRLNFDEDSEAAVVNGQLVVANPTDDVMPEETDENSSSSVDSKGNKRAKKGGAENNNKSGNLAGSLEGCRQSQ
ncbi:hypothetical protein QYE76_003101 [Lolium multiflorum]|uniref:Zinc knuckle CX2CX4HX4C domain-containing protein n=1 Tax=Lolium multiflorum TaxID=4521 RepID=A0AAD8W190_LOLMU|nr:hypothetical protein QYE76_003101 [Lolium multiflorum]